MSSENAVIEAPMTDRQKWRSMLDMLPLVEVEIASAQQARADANEALELAKRKHLDDVAAANHAEQAAAYSRGKINEAKAKLLASAPDAVKKRIANLEKQIHELRYADGADLVLQYKFQRDRYEQEFAVTKEPKDSNEFERYSQKLQRLESELSALQTQLDKALAEALMVD